MAVRIGDLLLKEKRITPAQLQEALNYQKTNGGKLGLNLVKLGFVTDEEITSLLSKQYGVPSINLTQFEIDQSVIKLIPADTAQKYQIVPLSRSGATLTIAITDPTNVFAMDDIKFMTGYNVEPVVASETAVTDAIKRYYPATAAAAPKAQKPVEKKPEKPKPQPQQASLTSAATLELVTKALEETTAQVVEDDVELLEELEQIDVASLERQGGEAPVIRLVNLMLMSAIQKGASDIHIEPYEKEFRVRFRIDGILYNVMAPPMKFRDAITSRLKIMAKLDIAEKRLPQDGRIKIRFAVDGATKEIDFRVSCLPTLFGEKIVMRLLDKDKLMLDMTKLGFEPESLSKLEVAIAKPWGMVLVTGPTGSGKTNTLYSSISKVNTTETNIMTAEDPVEFNLVGVNQVQIRENIGLELRRGAALVPAAGPEHHPGRRNPRLRDGRDRGQGRAHGPPRPLDAAHQRRAEHDQPADEHGHRAVPRRELGQPDLRPAPGAPRLCRVQGRSPACRRRRSSRRASRRTKPSASCPSAARAATSATRPATKAASACTRSWRSPRRCAS